MTPATDQELLERLHRGDASAAEAFWARHASGVRAFARAVVRSDADADDTVQRVFCDLLSLDRARLRAVRDVPAFLMRSVRNAALNRLRTERRERAKVAARARGAGASGPANSPEDRALRGALANLPRRQREIVVLRSVIGLTFDQAALALGIHRSTAASRHAAGLAALERMLKEPEPAESRDPVRVGGRDHEGG